MQPGAGPYAAEDLAVGRTNLQQADRIVERLVGQLFELVPQLKRPLHQRDVVGVLVIRLANQPALAMRAATVVARSKAIEPQRAGAPPRQVKQRRAADAAAAEHNGLSLLANSAGLKVHSSHPSWKRARVFRAWANRLRGPGDDCRLRKVRSVREKMREYSCGCLPAT